MESESRVPCTSSLDYAHLYNPGLDHPSLQQNLSMIHPHIWYSSFSYKSMFHKPVFILAYYLLSGKANPSLQVAVQPPGVHFSFESAGGLGNLSQP